MLFKFPLLYQAFPSESIYDFYFMLSILKFNNLAYMWIFLGKWYSA